MKQRYRYILLILIIILAAFLRLVDLGRADVITDEAFIAIRSVGYVDLIGSQFQVTPLDWFENLPWWINLSFHDHPPLVFLTQYLSFKVFGENLWALRIPFVLAGILSVLLIYLIGRRLFCDKAGLLAALLLAVSNYHLWLSRTGLQESFVILFILLTLWLFIKALVEKKYFYLMGLSLGLAFLTKYTCFFLLLFIFIYLLVFRRKIFLKKELWLSLLVAVVAFSPVIIYNIKLYQTHGHFDLQFSYFLGQKVEGWQNLPGKEIGSFSERLSEFIPNLKNSFSPVIFWLFLISFGVFIVLTWLIKNSYQKKNCFLILLIILTFGQLLVIGFSLRFLSLLLPGILLLITGSLIIIMEKIKSKGLQLIIIVICSFIIIYELFFSYFNFFTPALKYQKPFLYSTIKMEASSWGYNRLDDYLAKELKDRYPAKTLVIKYKILTQKIEQDINKKKALNFEPSSVLIVYDTNIFYPAAVWLMMRRSVYHGWPIISSDAYQNVLEGEVDAGIKLEDFEEIIFIKATERTLLRSSLEMTNTAVSLEHQLIQQGVGYQEIKDQQDQTVFKIYKF